MMSSISLRAFSAALAGLFKWAPWLGKDNVRVPIPHLILTVFTPPVSWMDLSKAIAPSFSPFMFIYTSSTSSLHRMVGHKCEKL
ncbi:hypothetical protein EYF80_015121 [Liparis tanakae]|uniref:Secreted protein n=1 Tax=Liparis tanakae TaxID=230148 RepID=A0A4Z2IB73_9TELE|nr:hypothetical protein EYF80_015121 [Liparis tanakae]